MSDAALGFRTHSGWAVMVAVTGTLKQPAVLLRRRIELTERENRAMIQPYHAAEPMELDEARAWIAECAQSARTLAAAAIREIRRKLHPLHRVASAGILQASGRPLPDLAGILAAHPLIHTAEGVFFRDAIQHACESLSVPVLRPIERDLLSGAASKIGKPGQKIMEAATELGRPLGRPWTQDEKLATIAAWLSLPDSV